MDLAREEKASPEEVATREAAAHRDLCCFVTLMNLNDTDVVLGLGLRVHARTVQQRRHGLPPDLDFTFDNLDVEAFNEGVPPAMVFSARGRLNGWLPLYVNARHWAGAR